MFQTISINSAIFLIALFASADASSEILKRDGSSEKGASAASSSESNEAFKAGDSCTSDDTAAEPTNHLIYWPVGDSFNQPLCLDFGCVQLACMEIDRSTPYPRLALFTQYFGLPEDVTKHVYFNVSEVGVSISVCKGKFRVPYVSLRFPADYVYADERCRLGTAGGVIGTAGALYEHRATIVKMANTDAYHFFKTYIYFTGIGSPYGGTPYALINNAADVHSSVTAAQIEQMIFETVVVPKNLANVRCGHQYNPGSTGAV